MDKMNPTKKAYRAPALVEYGRMENLTRGPEGTTSDSLMGRNGNGGSKLNGRSG